MTKQGLNELKELATEVDKLREKADELRTHIRRFLGYEVVVFNPGAHRQLSEASAAMRDTIPCMSEALIKLQKAYDAEKKLMDTYDGLLNERDDE